jgi:lysozyme
MTPRHQVSAAAIALIKRFEGLRLDAVQLGDGRWTIGYGHTRSAREGASVSQSDAEALLTYDLDRIGEAIDELVFTPLTQNQFDALASFVFNIGLEAFRRSPVLRRINEGALLQAGCAMEMWRKADFEGERIVIDALVRRRAAEKALFLTPDAGFVPASSAEVQPRMDHEIGIPTARPRPTELKTTLDQAPPSPIGSQGGLAGEPRGSSTERAASSLVARFRSIAPDDDGELEPFPTDPSPGSGEAARPEMAEAVRATVRSIFDQTREEPQGMGVAPLAVLGVIGFALFAGGLYWAFASRPAAGLFGSPIIGFALGFLGIVCVGSSVYFLLDRLSNPDDFWA